MRRLATLALTALLLPFLSVVPGASACAEAVCFTDEEARTGGDCEAWDQKDAMYNRYYNASANASLVQVEARSRFGCENAQPQPGLNGHWDDMFTAIRVTSLGRDDRAAAWYSYGNIGIGCSVGLTIDPDRTLIFNFREGADWGGGCSETGPLPAIAEALP